MARSSQYWVMVLIALFATAATAATLVHADETATSLKEEVDAAPDSILPPTLKEKIDDGQDLTKKEAAQAQEAVQTWQEWALKNAGEWTGKGKVAAGEASEAAKTYASQGAASVQSSSTKATEYTKGFYNKWSTWAVEVAGKYKPKINPAADAVSYINKHSPGSKEEEL